jgi:hypothetical protein
MGNLMPEHRGELRLRAHVGEDAPGEEDGAPWEGKGVDGGIVHDLEAPGQVRPLRLLGQAHAHLGDVLLERGVVDEANALDDLLLRALPELNLVLLGDEHELTLAVATLRTQPVLNASTRESQKTRGRIKGLLEGRNVPP